MHRQMREKPVASPSWELGPTKERRQNILLDSVYPRREMPQQAECVTYWVTK
jgi:hypothetical protein